MKNWFNNFIFKSRREGLEIGNRGVGIKRDESGRIIGTIDVERYFGVFDSKVSSENLITLFNEIAEIQFPIRAIAERALNADIYLKDFNTDSIIWTNKPINKFITQPNELESFDKFFLMLVMYYLLIGDGYVYSHVPKSLKTLPRWEACNNYYVLPSDKIKIETPEKLNLYSGAKAEDIIKSYRLKDGRNDIVFAPEDVLHISDVNMEFGSDLLNGRSRLFSLKYPISNLIAVYEARNVIFVKRGALGMLVSKKKDDSGSVPLSKKESEQVRKDYDEALGLTGGRSTIAVSNVEVDFVPIGISIKDLEPFRETLVDAIQIAGAFGVPADLVPKDGNSTFANKRMAEVSLYENTVIPITNRIIRAFNYWMGFREEKGDMYMYADFSKIPCLQPDKKLTAELGKLNSDKAIREFDGGVIMYNEMRVACGYEKVENGDYYVWESNSIRSITETELQNE